MIDLAFWGRCSTEDRQDPEASRAWQISRAKALVVPRGGRIVAEFFDVDKSRSIPPMRRPQAALLLGELANPDRAFSAVVVGEPQRAFYGNQFGLTFPLFEHYGVELWVPEVGGPIDPVNEAHELIMSMYGGISRGERNRIKTRVRTAMATQAQVEGRYLGGRPPYGYRLADAGPHPNPSKAADGKRLHRLDPDPITAPVVGRIFAEFVAGRGLLAIAEGLTRDGILCPSAYDRARNSHRSGIAWSKAAVRAILLNPRYTGMQVWNRQHKDEVLIDVNDVALGHVTKLRWNDQEDWIWSEKVMHEALVEEGLFAQAQALLVAPRTAAEGRKPRRTSRCYIFKGLLFCGVCERRMQGSWNNGKPHYRCVFPKEYAQANSVEHPRSVYVREELIIEPLDEWLATAFDPAHFADTVREMADAQLANDHRLAAVQAARDSVTECERKLAGYRAALDAGTDPVVVAGWITETEAKRKVEQMRLDQATSKIPKRLTEEEIAAMATRLGDLRRLLRSADPQDKADVYEQLGLRMTYDPGRKTVIARAQLRRSCTKLCPRGDLNQNTMPGWPAKTSAWMGSNHGSQDVLRVAYPGDDYRRRCTLGGDRRSRILPPHA
ncbi:recombinase family protein [Nonomuraea sp. NPDC050556]|uniref:recombinase family protein n=1 Tax=Nonomuraea sp. NPDC050556 TaxID=3364369 RepID=UPI0037990D0E